MADLQEPTWRRRRGMELHSFHHMHGSWILQEKGGERERERKTEGVVGRWVEWGKKMVSGPAWSSRCCWEKWSFGRKRGVCYQNQMAPRFRPVLKNKEPASGRRQKGPRTGWGWHKYFYDRTFCSPQLTSNGTSSNNHFYLTEEQEAVQKFTKFLK